MKTSLENLNKMNHGMMTILTELYKLNNKNKLYLELKLKMDKSNELNQNKINELKSINYIYWYIFKKYNTKIKLF